jgi:hypothetical protein
MIDQGRTQGHAAQGPLPPTADPAHARTSLSTDGRCATPCPTASRAASSCCWRTTTARLTLWHAGAPAPAAHWSEVMRKFPSRPAADCRRAGAAHQRRLRKGESSAATVVSEVQNDADLSRMMQELPAVEDLLEPATTRPSSACSTRCSRRPRATAPATSTSSPTSAFVGALPRRRHAARSGAAQPRAARGADLAPEDHGRPRHRREAPAAGRPHLAAHRHPRGRRARVHAAQRTRRTRRAAPAGQEREQAQPRIGGHDRRHAVALPDADRAAARHHPRDRPDRLGQDHHAVFGAGAARRHAQQHHDGGRPDRVRAARCRPDAGQRQDRPRPSPRPCARSCGRTRT